MSQSNNIICPLYRPRQILDLPDEILQRILGFCCSDEDLEFLLWSCRLITVKDQFCHDCFHCDLCHGPYIYPQSPRQQQRQFGCTRVDSTTDTGLRPTQCHRLHRKRRLPASIIAVVNADTSGGDGGNNGNGDILRSHRCRWLAGLDLGYLFTGVRRCPWNNHQRWRGTHQHHRYNIRALGALSNSWSIFSKSLFSILSPSSSASTTELVAAAMAGMMKSDSHRRRQISGGESDSGVGSNVGAGNGDPVVARHEPPGVQESSCMMNNFGSSDNNNSNSSMSALSASESRPAFPQMAIGEVDSSPFLPKKLQQGLQGSIFPFPPPRHCIGKGNEGGGCMNDENHNDGHEQSVPPARTKSSFLLSSTSCLHQPLPLTAVLSSSSTASSQMREVAQIHRAEDACARDSAHSMANPILLPTVDATGQDFQHFLCPKSQSQIQTSFSSLSQLQMLQQQHIYPPSATELPQVSSIELSIPFQLLLVSKRFGNMVVQTLWDRVVFHGHDSVQVRALLSTLSRGAEEQQQQQQQMNLNDGKDHDGKGKREEEMEARFSYRTDARNRFIRGDYKINRVNKRNINTVSRCPLSPSSKGSSLDNLDRASPLCWSARTISSASSYRSDNVDCDYHVKGAVMALGPGGKSLSPAAAPLLGLGPERSCAADFTARPHGDITATEARNRWSYGQFVRRIVLNFAHAKASRSLLVETLECLGESHRRHGQDYFALDLHANEKIRSSGGADEKRDLKTMDLSRLFGYGSGFSNLACLRLRGGFVDNQLLNALTSGMQARNLQRSGSSSAGMAINNSRLAQVFLGPGSFTDSAIEKLIEVAGSSLEVVMVTSCVDIGGESLAKFLTQCPKLRVLGFYRSLARDEDLFLGLGVHSNMESMAEFASSSRQVTASVDTIVAPLERLELSAMVKLTTKGVATIIQGVSRTLKHLVLDSRHFHENFLGEILLPSLPGSHTGGLKGLVSLSFKDESFRQQQQQRHQQSVGTNPDKEPLGRFPSPRSLWLGDSLSDEWVTQGGGSGIEDYAYSPMSSMDYSRVPSLQQSTRGTGDRILNSFRRRGKVVLDKIRGRHANVAAASTSTIPLPRLDEEEYEALLERCSVQQETVSMMVSGLSQLRSFTVLKKDIILESEAYLQRQRSKAIKIESEAVATAAATVTYTKEALTQTRLVSRHKNIFQQQDRGDQEDDEVTELAVDETEAVVEDTTMLTSTLTMIRWVLILSAIMTWVAVVVQQQHHTSQQSCQ